MKRTFKFKPFLALFCFLMMLVFFVLGSWQMIRANEKEALQVQFDEKQSMARMNVVDLFSGGESDVSFRKVSATGHFFSDEAFYVDNVVLDGVVGYLQHAPFVTNEGKVILVNLGWIQAPKNRGDIPEINLPEDQIKIEGTLVEPRSKPVLLGDLPKPDLEDPRLWFYVDLAYLQSKIKKDILPLVLELDPGQALANKVSPTKFDAKVGMHIGYAIQWYVFILFVLIGYLSLSFTRKQSE